MRSETTKEPRRTDGVDTIPPVTLRRVRARIRPGVRSVAAAAFTTVPMDDGVFTITADAVRSGNGPAVWRVDVDAAVEQPQERAAQFLEQDTFDADYAVDAVVAFPEGAPNGPFLCVYQHKEWWMRPAWAGSPSDVPERTQMMLWKDGDVWSALVAVCGDDARADLYGAADGLHLTVGSGRVGRTALADVVCYAALADDPYDAVRACVAAAADRLGIRTVDGRPIPDALSGFGWCTWDSLGRRVSEDTIVEKMEEFRAKGIPVSWVMIDDGWSMLDREAETLVGFDADAGRFPRGLRHTVDLLRERYGVRHVGVWAAFQGYWRGIDPRGDVAARTRDRLVETSNGTLIPAADYGRASAFWSEWLSRLRADGIDCVKIDSQSSVSTMVRGVESYGEATRGRHRALDLAVESEMSGALINCMGMAPEDYWHRPSSPVTRTSDDFMPHDPPSLSEHLTQNAYCSVLMRELYHCDWDMFWSEHPHARAHALTRVLSGGPVYCSDAAGHSDPDVLMPLMLSDGRVPRPDIAAVPAVGALLADPSATTEAWHLRAGCGDWRIEAYIGLNPHAAQTAAVDAGDRGGWLVDWAGRSARTLRPGESVSVTLAYGECRLFYVRDLPDPDDAVVPVGLIDKMLAPACIDDVDGSCGGSSMEIGLADRGVFAFLDPAGRCVGASCDGAKVAVERRGALCLCPVRGDSRRVRLDLR